jgi:hypothetical protein
VQVAQLVGGHGVTGLDPGYPAGDPTAILALPGVLTLLAVGF